MNIKKKLKQEMPNVSLDIDRIKEDLVFRQKPQKRFMIKPLTIKLAAVFVVVVLFFVVTPFMFYYNSAKSGDNSSHYYAPESDEYYEYNDPASNPSPSEKANYSDPESADSDPLEPGNIGFDPSESGSWVPINPNPQAGIGDIGMPDYNNSYDYVFIDKTSDLDEEGNNYYIITNLEELSDTFSNLGLNYDDYVGGLETSNYILVNFKILNNNYSMNNLNINIDDYSTYSLITLNKTIDVNNLKINIK